MTRICYKKRICLYRKCLVRIRSVFMHTCKSQRSALFGSITKNGDRNLGHFNFSKCGIWFCRIIIIDWAIGSVLNFVMLFCFDNDWRYQKTTTHACKCWELQSVKENDASFSLNNKYPLDGGDYHVSQQTTNRCHLTVRVFEMRDAVAQ